MKNQTFLSSIRIAFFGIITAFKKERNFRIQCCIALVVLLLAQWFHISVVENCIVIITILVVLSLELINSQIEKFLDLINPELHPKVKIIKDFSAGAVLLSALGSIVIGVLIFLPHML